MKVTVSELKEKLEQACSETVNVTVNMEEELRADGSTKNSLGLFFVDRNELIKALGE